MSLEVYFYGGANDYENGELGGVQILFKDTKLDSSFMLDFGQRPDHTNQYYNFPYRPKSFQSLSISELLELYPDIPNLYRHDYNHHEFKTTQKELPFDGILLTHPHYDHIGGITLVRYDMPVHMHQQAKQLLWLWQYTSGRTVNQFVDVIDQFSLGYNTKGDKKFLTGDEAIIPRNIQLYESYKPFKLKNFTVTAYPVDHSTPGSHAFIIETSIGKIAISGDIRKRGGRPKLTEKFVEAVKEQKPKYIFWEGSLLHFPHFGTEKDLSNVVAKKIKDREFAAIAYPPRDFDRITSLYRAAKKTNRMLVVSPAQALALQMYNGVNGYPKITNKYIGVYLGRKRKGLADREIEKGLEQQVERDYYKWERKFLDIKTWGESGEHKSSIQRVTLNDMKHNQDKFLMYMPANNMIDVLEVIRPKENSIYIRSHPAPWTKEMEIGEDQQIAVLKKFNMYDGEQPDSFEPSTMRKMHQVHITGHLNRDETKEILNQFTESTIIPYHAMFPKNFPEDVTLFRKNIVPFRKQKMILD